MSTTLLLHFCTRPWYAASRNAKGRSPTVENPKVAVRVVTGPDRSGAQYEKAIAIRKNRLTRSEGTGILAHVDAEGGAIRAPAH